MYVVDTALKHVRVFDVGADAVLTGGRVFATCDAGSFDGLRLRSQAEPPLRDVLELGLRPEGQRQWRPLAAGPPATARWLLRQHTGWTAAGQRG